MIHRRGWVARRAHSCMLVRIPPRGIYLTATCLVRCTDNAGRNGWRVEFSRSDRGGGGGGRGGFGGGGGGPGGERRLACNMCFRLDLACLQQIVLYDVFLLFITCVFA